MFLADVKQRRTFASNNLHKSVDCLFPIYLQHGLQYSDLRFTSMRYFVVNFNFHLVSRPLYPSSVDEERFSLPTLKRTLYFSITHHHLSRCNHQLYWSVFLLNIGLRLIAFAGIRVLLTVLTATVQRRLFLSRTVRP